MALEYVVKRESNPLEAKIFSGNNEVGEIKMEDYLTFRLISGDGREWNLTNKVHGEARPFSLTVAEAKGGHEGKVILTIKEHLFKYNNKFYMLTNQPEGKSWSESLTGPKYIGRLDNFPFSDLKEIDRNTMQKIRRFFRGTHVGEFSGLGVYGHRVKIGDELADIGLILAACSYILYSTAHIQHNR
jgi:hypothetical protein